jgi:gliding motility-associated transport system permease protein
MLNMLAILRKELRTYFVSPVAYVVIAAYLLMSGVFFAILVTAQPGSAPASLSIVFGNVAVVLLLVAPALTMRLLAEEQKSGTIEVLLTSPVQDWEVVVGKYLSSVVLFLIPVAITLVYALVLRRYGTPDVGPIVGGYVGIILFGAAFLAVGVLATSLTQNQVVAAVISIAILLGLWLIGAFSSSAQAPVSTALSYLSIITHYNEFSQGVVDTRDVVYYLSVVAIALFLSVRVLETRRWT